MCVMSCPHKHEPGCVHSIPHLFGRCVPLASRLLESLFQRLHSLLDPPELALEVARLPLKGRDKRLLGFSSQEGARTRVCKLVTPLLPRGCDRVCGQRPVKWTICTTRELLDVIHRYLGFVALLLKHCHGVCQRCNLIDRSCVALVGRFLSPTALVQRAIKGHRVTSGAIALWFSCTCPRSLYTRHLVAIPCRAFRHLGPPLPAQAPPPAASHGRGTPPSQRRGCRSPPAFP